MRGVKLGWCISNFILTFFFEWGSRFKCFVPENGLELLIRLPPLPKCWDYRCAPPILCGVQDQIKDFVHDRQAVYLLCSVPRWLPSFSTCELTCMGTNPRSLGPWNWDGSQGWPCAQVLGMPLQLVPGPYSENVDLQ